MSINPAQIFFNEISDLIKIDVELSADLAKSFNWSIVGLVAWSGGVLLGAKAYTEQQENELKKAYTFYALGALSLGCGAFLMGSSLTRIYKIARELLQHSGKMVIACAQLHQAISHTLSTK